MRGFSLRPAALVLSFIAGTAVLSLGTGLASVSADQLGASPPPIPSAAPITTASTAPSIETSPGSTATEAPTTGRHRRHHHDDNAATAIPAPTESAAPAGTTYTSFGGTWEIQLQRGAQTTYSHIVFEPNTGAALVGQWIDGTRTIPITGELDGDRFRMAGSNAQGPFTLSGYEENFTNLVGLMLQGAARVPFTARHQPSPAQGSRHKHHHHQGDSTTPPHE